MEDILHWENRVYVPQKLCTWIIQTEHDSKIAGHFGRDRTLELIARNFSWPNMETDFRKYCDGCNNGQTTKIPRHAKHGLQHLFKLDCKSSTHIGMDFISDLPESEGATLILEEIDQFTKMAHVIPIRRMHSPLVGRAYFQNVWKYHGFPEVVVSDRDATFTGQFFVDLHEYLGTKRSMSTAFPLEVLLW